MLAVVTPVRTVTWGQVQRRRVIGAALVEALLALLLVLGTASAQAAVPFKDISSGGPLTHVYVGNELGCQVAYRTDSRLELFPPSTIPGDCGTFVAAGGTLYAPDFANHGGTATSGLGGPTAFQPVSQSSVSGSGTSSNPFKVTTKVNVGSTGLRISEIDSYVSGDESYRTDVTITNGSGGALSGQLYRAGDCYLQESDVGFGFVDQPRKAAGCSLNANNSPAARIEQWFPVTGSNQYFEGTFSEVWTSVGSRQPLPNTCRCTEQLDNGAGLSWAFSLGAGRSATYSNYTVFSPRGISGPPRPPLFGPNGVVQAPSNRHCVSKRKFRIRIRQPGDIRIQTALLFLNGKRVKVFKHKVFKRLRHVATVNLRGLPKGTWVLKIVVLTTKGDTLRGKRKYHTCVKKRKHKRPPRL
jgi:hypothetical protein